MLLWLTLMVFGFGGKIIHAVLQHKLMLGRLHSPGPHFTEYPRLL